MAEAFDSSRHSGRRRPPKTPYKAKKHSNVCRYFLEGTCKKGTECRFLHDVSQKRQEEFQDASGALPGEEELDVPDFTKVRCIFGRVLKTMEEMHLVKARIHRLKRKIYLSGSKEGKEVFRKEFEHKTEKIIIDYLEVPKDVSAQYVLGRGGRTLIVHLESENDISCEMCFAKDKPMIKLMSLTKESIERVKKNFRAGIFATTPLLDGILCLDTTKSEFRLCFKPHNEYHAWHLSRKTRHTLQLDLGLKKFADDSECDVTALEKGIQQMRLQPLHEPLSPKKRLPDSSSTISWIPPGGFLHQDNLLYLRQWLLDRVLNLQEEKYTGQLRIEGRIGKLLWIDLPQETASSNFSLADFQDCADVLRWRNSFSTYIKGPFEELTENLGKPTVVDTYDFKLSSEKFRRLDLRVAKLDDGKLNLYAAFANEAKTFTANWVFLDKQSDVRISLSTRICVSLRNPEIRKFLESIKLRNGRLSVEKEHKFRAHYLRHKVLSCYTLAPPFDRYCIEIAKVRDFEAKQCGYLEPGTTIDPDFPPDSTHYEIELQNLDWLAAFCLSAENSSDDFFRIWKRPVPVAAKESERPWEARKIVEELPNFMENLQLIVDILDSNKSQ